MSTPCPKLLLMFVLLATVHIGLTVDTGHNLAKLERSFWLHASLAATAQKGYYAIPFQEIVAVYSSLKDGKSPGNNLMARPPK